MKDISPQKAADLLNVSRPYVILLLNAGEIPFRMVGKRRRLRTSDVLAYKARSQAPAEQAFSDMVAHAQELGVGYD
ncbi:MAG: excisionase family DNA-binding protein [Gemmatimonadota bacterium]